MRKFSFIKGILPNDGLDFSGGRDLSQERVLEQFTPKEVLIPLYQSMGTPAVPIVRVGSVVSIGQMIAKPTSPLSAPVHASISGTVTAVETIKLPSGIACDAIRITNDLKRRLDDSVQKRLSPENLLPKDLRRLLLFSGIVGMGGEGYPAAAKCRKAERAGVDTLYVNGLQSEPHLTCDIHLMREHAERVILGAVALGSVCRVQKVVFCIQDKWKQEIDIMSAALYRIRPSYPDRELSLCIFKSRFPQGYDKLMIKALYKTELTMEQSIEDTVHAVVFNVSTCAAFWEKVEKNLPCTSRVVTISVDTTALRNVLVPIGTLVSELLDRIPGTGACIRIVMGGALTGVAVTNLNTPVLKTTQGITLIRQERPQNLPCVQCGYCVEACPVGILPYLCERLIVTEDFETLKHEGIDACISCGACSYACPSGIELSAHIARAAHDKRTMEGGL
jgi:electron transport complex protein RnfC